MKRLLILTAALVISALSFGQGISQLPNDTTVVTGKLDNGMTYYIRHNAQPAQRAEFYLATNVGAFQEADDQDGLAHFLEHMCFNGTKNFPGKSLLDYLQGIGAEFGRNINASTGFEQTQYMLNNIPIIREGIIDSCLLVMHDYAHFVTCDPVEIDAERSVILEEKRTRNNANWRILEKSLPYYFGDTPYSRRTLIGGEEQLKTFKHESLTNFYHTWYRPDMQAIIVVGDIDVRQIEEKIRKTFSDIPAPEVPTVKPVIKIPGNEEPVIAILTDPELTGSSIDIMWKMDAMPDALNSTDAGYMMDLVGVYVSLIMNERFSDIKSKVNAPFLNASFGISGLCNSTDAVSGSVSFEEGEAVKAFTAFLTEVEKMKRFGFTEAEVKRASDNIISSYEKAAEAAPTRKNSDFIKPLLNHFFHQEAYMDPAMELEFVKALCAQLNPDIIRQVFTQITPTFNADKNILIMYNGPQKDGLADPTAEELGAVLTAVRNAEIKANEAENVQEPLLDADALKGSPVKKTKAGIYGATEWTLKNGLKVVVLPTDYKKDQVIINLYKDGGKSLIEDEDLYSFEENIFSIYQANTGVGKFPKTTLKKMLAGKIASAAPFINGSQHGINASSSPKDLETAFQLLYMYFMNPRFDVDEYERGMQQIKAVLPNVVSQPSYKLQSEITKTLYGSNPRAFDISEEVVEKADLKTIERVYRSLFSDVAGATVLVIGNVDLDTLKPLVEKYLGSLPKGKKGTEWKDRGMRIVEGEVKNHFDAVMQNPKSTVIQLYTADIKVNTVNETILKAAKYIMDMIYTETIREDEGGTYGVGVGMDLSRLPEDMAMIQIRFDTNPEMAARLSGIAAEGLKKVAKEGPTQAQVDMAKENLKKNIPEQRITNTYWLSAMKEWYMYGTDSDKEVEDAINALTPESIRDMMAEIISQGNFVEFIMSPEE